ncbi:hypothetical protein BH10PSE1_BH10PSE1_18110 [soil metagenome]
MSGSDPEIAQGDLERLVLSLVETCVRNTGLEMLHAGRFPHSSTGDYADVRVVTPNDDIPWAEVSRISDDEMKALMIEVVDRVYTCLRHPEVLDGLRTATANWNRPKLDDNLMKRVDRLRENRAPGDDSPD